VLGAVPGAALGALAVPDLPARVLTVASILVTLFALARQRGLFALSPPPWAWTPFAFGAGVFAAGSGAGVIAAPVRLAGGLNGRTLIATGAGIAMSMYVGRIFDYALGGLYGRGRRRPVCHRRARRRHRPGQPARRPRPGAPRPRAGRARHDDHA